MSNPENTDAELEAAAAQLADADGDGHDDTSGQFVEGNEASAKAKKSKPAAVVGEVVKKGKPAPTAAELGDDPSQAVRVRITGRGDKQVHDGNFGRYDAGDEVILPLGVAQTLRGDPNDKKALGYVEIIGKA